MQLVSEFDVLVIVLFHPLPTKDLPGMVRQAVPELTRKMRLGMLVVPVAEEPGTANSHTQFVEWGRREVRRAAMNNS